jgi:hypothetical protein
VLFADGKSKSLPMGVVIDKYGDLLVANDLGNTI